MSFLYTKVNWLFPLLKCYGIPVFPHPGCFGYPRHEDFHTGVDLYTNDGDQVFAMEDGKVVSIEHFTGDQDKSPWWNNTDCILVEGDSGVVCYGEVTVQTDIKVGSRIHRGQLIAQVKRVIKEGKERPEITGWSPSMLHVEWYPHGYHKASDGFDDYLLDPTDNLLRNAPSTVKSVTYAHYKPSKIRT